MGWDPTADGPLACYGHFPPSGPHLSFMMAPNTFRNDLMALRNAEIITVTESPNSSESDYSIVGFPEFGGVNGS